MVRRVTCHVPATAFSAIIGCDFFIRRANLRVLENVIGMDTAVSYRKYNGVTRHRTTHVPPCSASAVHHTTHLGTPLNPLQPQPSSGHPSLRAKVVIPVNKFHAILLQPLGLTLYKFVLLEAPIGHHFLQPADFYGPSTSISRVN